MSQLEAEARIKIAERWTATVFAGVACTYGGVKDCSESANLFPMAGAGVQYVLKPELGIVLNLEYAQGKDGNNGVILKTGYTIALCAAYVWMPTAAGTPSVATVRNRPAASG